MGHRWGDCLLKSLFMETNGSYIALLIFLFVAGQERFRTLTSSYYRGAQGIILGNVPSSYQSITGDCLVNVLLVKCSL